MNLARGSATIIALAAAACGDSAVDTDRGTGGTAAAGGSGGTPSVAGSDAGGGASGASGIPGASGASGTSGAGGSSPSGTLEWPGTRLLPSDFYEDAIPLPSGALLMTSRSRRDDVASLLRFGKDDVLVGRRSPGLTPEQLSTDSRRVLEDSDGNITFVSLLEDASVFVLASFEPDLDLRWVRELGEGARLVGQTPDGAMWAVRAAFPGLEFVVTSSNGESTPAFTVDIPGGSRYTYAGVRSDGVAFALDSAADQGTLRTFRGSASAISTCTLAFGGLLDWDDDAILIEREGNIALVGFDCDERWSTAREYPHDTRLHSGSVISFGATGSRVLLRAYDRVDGAPLWQVDVGPATPQSSYIITSIVPGSSPGELIVAGHVSAGAANFPSFILHLDAAGNELSRQQAPAYPLTSNTRALAAMPDRDGGTRAILADAGGGFMVRWDPEGNFDEGSSASGKLHCFDPQNRICTELDQPLFELFRKKCVEEDGARFMSTSCATVEPPVLLCDGTNFDINGTPVDGRAYFLQGTRLSCAQMVNACGSANGSVGAGCAGDTLAPSTTHEVTCPGVEPQTHYVPLAPATPECQTAQAEFAEAHICNDIARFDATLAAFETCYRPRTY